MINIESERLIIRDHNMDDIEPFHSLISNKENMFFLPEILTHSREESLNNLFKAVEECNRGKDRLLYFFGVFLKDGTYIGEMGYTLISHNHINEKNVHLGYFLKKEYWGKGYATEALKRLLDFSFQENNVIKVETGCLVENTGSENVMVKCGFQREAYKKCHQYLHGKWQDRVEYALLRGEYLHKKGERNIDLY